MVTLGVLAFISIVVAVAMSMVAWRVVQHERMRSAARVAALAAEIRDVDRANDLPLRPEAAPAGLVPMFATVNSEGRNSRLMFLTAIVLIGGAVGVSLVLFSPLGSRTSTPAASQAQVAQTLPLQLIALGHEREADSLVVRGVLRNPSNGVEVDALTAVVMLFNHDGGLIGSGRAAVEASKLLPGGETAFVVTVPGAGNVERYRVSFRNSEQVVPHVDQRS
jgi:hypothetical protein